MKYSYYPGCSLTESALEFDVATRLVFQALGAELTEIDDWTCCGASAIESVSRLLTYTLPARNLALAELNGEGSDILVPCAACYLNLLRVEREAGRDKALAAQINEVLAVEEMQWTGSVRVRHLVDVLANDIGAERIADAVIAPLSGIVIAPYYGCQILRPYPVFDDPETPRAMEPLIQALGAQVLDWSMGAHCCGASLMATKKDVALQSVGRILKAAQSGETPADVIATVCPLCQMNLEAYQSEALDMIGGGRRVSVAYLPQLMGLAMGMDESDVKLNRNMEITREFRARLSRRAELEEETEPAT